MRLVRISPVAILASLAVAIIATGCSTNTNSTLIRGGTIADGTGAELRRADVRIAGDSIVAIGELAPLKGERVIDATGLLLTPGFIDTHSHHDGQLGTNRDALAAVSQGITTIVAGQDGSSADSLASEFAALEKNPAAVNVASYIGHNSVRSQVMGEDFRRAATPEEVARMRALVEEGMRAGALGLATGLEYDPGIYAAREEVMELAKVAALHNGRYISHIRSEDRHFWSALDELIAIGRETGMPVQVSHIKLAMRSLWGRSDSLIRVLDRARNEGIDVTADLYPYRFWQSTLTVLFPERNFTDRAEAEFVLREVSAPDGLLLSAFAPNTSYVGKTVADIAAERKTDPATTLMALIDESQRHEREHPDQVGRVEGVIGTSMSEEDIAAILRWPHVNICSDGGLIDRHPRGRGAFTRVLGRYVREQQVLTWPDAIRKMTSLAASHVGIARRGTIAPGMSADLVLLDSATVADRATSTDPFALSAGIQRVWVNGEIVFENGRATGRYPGSVIRRAE